jgi:hypothetical protein
MAFGQWLRETVSPGPAARLARRQRKHPPRRIPGISDDRGRRLYYLLEPCLPAGIRKAFADGRAVIGEVGIAQPAAFAEPLRDGYVIEVFTGLPDFFYSISRAMHSQAQFQFGETSPQAQVMAQIDQTVAAIEEIFRIFQKTEKIAKPANYPISQDQLEMASTLSTHAEAFVVAHEIGHLQIWEREPNAPRESSLQIERLADEIAVQFVLGLYCNEPVPRKRMVYAGAEFAVRVFAGLEHLGKYFGQDTHPLPTRRLESIRAAARELCGSHREYVRLIRLATMYDQFLEDMERRIAGPARAEFVVGPDPERLLSFIGAQIEECARSGITEQFAVEVLTSGFETPPRDAVVQAAVEAANLFLVEGSADDPALAAAEAAQFVKIAEQLPEPWRTIFDQAIQAAKSP